MITVKLSRDKKKLGIDNCFDIKDELMLLGAKWSNPHKLWLLPATPLAVSGLMELAELDVNKMEDDLLQLVSSSLRVKEARAQKLEVFGDGPESKTVAWGHQIKAYNFIMKVWGLE